MTNVTRSENLPLNDFMSTHNVTENVLISYRQQLERAEEGGEIIPSTLNDLGIALVHHFWRTGDLANVNEAICVHQQAISLTPDRHSEFPSRLSNLGNAFLARSSHIGDLEDIEDALSAHQEAVEHTPEGHVLRPTLLNNLGNSYLKLFEHSGVFSDIEEAVRLHLLAARTTPEYDDQMPTRLNNAARSLNARSQHNGSIEDIHQAIAAQRRAIALTKDGDENMYLWMENLGHTLMSLFECTGSLQDVIEAVELRRKAMEHTPSDHAIYPSYLNNLGFSLLGRFRHTGEVADLHEAISLQETAVQLTPKGHANMSNRVNNLGNSFLSRFERTGDVSDVNEAIRLHQLAVNLVPDDQRINKATFMGSLGNSFLRRFQRNGNLTDIDAAIHAHQSTVDSLPQGAAGFSHALSDLGVAFMSRFQYTGNNADIEQAIILQRNAVNLLSDNHVDKPPCLNSLSNSYRRRFEINGDMADIDTAIESNQKAVLLCADNHANMPIWLSNLGTSFRVRFERTGNMEDIDEAIHAQQRAVQLTPPDNRTGMAGRMNNLGSSYAYRFEFSMSKADLDEAIAAHQEAVRLTADDHAELSRRLSNVGNSLLRRFEQNDEIVDMEQAVQAHRKAVERTPEGHSDFPGILNNFAICLVRMFESSGDFKHVDEAIEAYKKCMGLLEEGHPDMSIWLYNLGNAFLKRFEKSEDIADIDEAIRAHQRCKEITPEAHAAMPDWIAALGDSFLARYETTWKAHDLKAGIAQFRIAANSAIGRPSSRIEYARRWASLVSIFDPAETLLGFKIALELLPQVVSLGKTIANRQARLSAIADLANEAAAHAIEQGRFNLALEWLEQGRCVIWNQLNGLRTLFDDVRDINPKLADKLDRVSEALERAGTRSIDINNSSTNIMQKITMEEKAREHSKLSQEWDTLLVEVRQISGLENFLRPVGFLELSKRAPEAGSVVVINVHPRSCDALVMSSKAKDVAHIPLPLFSFDQAKHLQKSLGSCLSYARLRSSNTRSGRVAANLPSMGLKEILFDLWETVGKPIMDGLGYSVSDNPPRIWWCTTGPLAFLPIHAAGVYKNIPTSGNRVSDYVISSYTPTLSAVASQSTEPVKKFPFRGILGVSQPNTPGQLPIPSTTKEVRQVQNRFLAYGLHISVLDGPAATVKNVMEKMETHSWIHLACHAVQNTVDSTKSAFYLEDGPLELSAIIQKRIPCADFAFLSACQTGMGDENLSEEAIHLAAGMLSAGYKGVIATMWSIPDDYAPMIAQDVYSGLLKERVPDSSLAAQSLHFATIRLRDSLGLSESSLFSWVPFIHLGL